jgi:hypothetical protein
MLKDFQFIQMGETALKGAAKLGFEAIEVTTTMKH